MRIEDYSLKFSLLSRYAPYLVSNPRDGMTHFVMGVANLMREECRMEMLHDDMTLARLMCMPNQLKSINLRGCLDT